MDRGAWVSAIDLEIGETLETLTGTTVVESMEKRPEPETVYNIEVEGDHVYRVGESGVLAHNNSPACSREGFSKGISTPSDSQLRTDVETIHDQFLPDERAHTSRVTAIAVFTDPCQRDCRRKVFAVSSNRTLGRVTEEANRRGYQLETVTIIPGVVTHAERILLNYASDEGLLREDIDTPVAPSKNFCDVLGSKNNQQCFEHLSSAPGVRPVFPQ